MGYEFDPNRYEGDEDSSTTEKAANDAQKDDKNKTSSTTSETNKDVDSSGGISELKVNLKDLFVNFGFTNVSPSQNTILTLSLDFLRHLRHFIQISCLRVVRYNESLKLMKLH